MVDILKLSKLNKKHLRIAGVVVLLLALPLTLLLLNRIQDQRSSAAAPDKLEAEAGVLTSSGVSKQTDSAASGGQFIKFAKSGITPTPTSPPSSGQGPRTTPPTPTGTNVRIIPDSIDGSGNTDVSSDLQSFVNNSPDGSIIVFPAGKTYKFTDGLNLDNRNNLTFWGYGTTLYATKCNSHTTTTFSLGNNKNIKILGFKIRGDNQYAGTENAWNVHGCGEFSMGITLGTGNDGIEIADNHISRVYGDGIFLFTFEKTQSSNINMHHNLIELTGRQGITINEGTNLRIEWNIVRDIAMSIIAIEDQVDGHASLEDIYIRNNIFSNWNWYHRQFEIQSSTAGNPTIVTTKTDHNFYGGWLAVFSHSGMNDGWAYENATIIDTRRISYPRYSSGGTGGTIEHYWASAGMYGGDSAEEMIVYKNFYIENNSWLGGDVGINRVGTQQEELMFSGTVPKVNFNIRNNTFNLPTDQRSGIGMRIRNAQSGEVSGNTIHGQDIICTGCSTGYIIQNNN